MMRAATVTVLCCVLGACADADPELCDPLAMDEVAITLDDVIAVGRDAEGTLYVLEQTADGDAGRVFVSDDEGTLWRRRTSGSGGGTDGDQQFFLATFEDGDRRRSLVVAIDAQGEVRMSLVDGDDDELRGTDPDEAGEPLEVLPNDTVTAAPVRNLPGEVTLEYLARVEDGRGVVVTRPSDDWSYEDFRLFLGTPKRMLERPVGEVIRARDGGSTIISFTLDGSAASLAFPVRADGSLSVGNRTFAVERLDGGPEELGDFRFLCR